MYMNRAVQVYDKSKEYATKGFNEASSTTDLAYDVKDGATNVAYNAKDGATNVAYDAKDGATNVAYDAKDGATNVAYNAKDGATNVAYNAKDGLTGLAYDVKYGAESAYNTISGKALYYMLPLVTMVIALTIMMTFFGKKYLPSSINEYNSSFWAFPKLPKHFFIFIISTSIAFLFSILPYGKKIRENMNTWKVFYIISGLIFLGTFIIIGLCTSFVEVFENTIGVSLLSKANLNRVFDKFQPKMFPEANIDLTYLVRLFNVNNFTYYFDNFMKTTILNKTVEGSPFIDLKYKNINEHDYETTNDKNRDKSDFLTAFRSACSGTLDVNSKENSIYHENYNPLQNTEGKYDKDPFEIGQLRQDLFNICLEKFTTGHLSWMYFAGLISILASISQVV